MRLGAHAGGMQLSVGTFAARRVCRRARYAHDVGPGEGKPLVAACIVNHNTSPFAELALRSLCVTHDERVRSGALVVAVLDNGSHDDGVVELQAAADQLGATFEPTRWPASAGGPISHGDALRHFVLTHPTASHYLFVDADVVFTEPDCVWTMLAEVEGDADVWATQARFQRYEAGRGEGASLDIWAGRRHEVWLGYNRPAKGPFLGVHKPRLHPACALIVNRPVFRRVTETIGLSAAAIISADEQLAGIADTMGLASMVMATHGLRYVLSSVTVCHYFGVTTDHPDNPIAGKLPDCLRRLEALRVGRIPEPGPWG